LAQALGGKAKREKAEQPAPAPRTAAEAGASAAQNAAMGLKDIADGLNALFGTPGKLSSGLTFDEDTYAKAKPLFAAGVRHFAQAGADILFPEALTSEEEMRRVCSELDTPMMANMAHGGVTPILSTQVLEEIGFALAIFPALTSLAAAAAYERSLTALQQTGQCTPADAEQFDFKAFCQMIGFEDVWAFERKWRQD
jgi:hypothetical protein